MTDHPMIFSAPMIRALIREADLPGTGKRMTRRLLTRLRGFGQITEFGRSDTRGYDWHFRDHRKRWNDVTRARLAEVLPYAEGDRIWVRETWRTHRDHDEISPANLLDGNRCVLISYAADADSEDWLGRHRSSIHMPRWASRLTLTVTDVRVEELQDISEADAIAEGVSLGSIQMCDGSTQECWFGVPHIGDYNPVNAYRTLWQSLHNPHGYCAEDEPNGWAADPWVCAITFTVARANIDNRPTREAA